MPEFSSLKDLYVYVNKVKTEALETDVAEMAKHEMEKHIQTDVYAAYKPTGYTRTYDLLKDVESEMVDADTLEIKDTRYGIGQNGERRDVVKVIEYGRGYDWSPHLDEKIGPRPFIANTRDEIEREQLATKTLKEALNNKGIKTE